MRQKTFVALAGFLVLLIFSAFAAYGTAAPTGTWTQVNEGGFGDTNNQSSYRIAVYNGKLYLGIHGDNGAQVYEYDGSNWTQVTPSWDTNYNIGVNSMAVHNGKLYVGTLNYSTGAEVWEYGSEWTSVTPEWCLSNYAADSMAEYNGKLYVATYNSYGAQVWKYGSEWTSVTTGWSSSNIRAYSMVEHNGKLYVGTNNGGGAEVWGYDGTTWTQESTGWDASNLSVRSMAVHNGTLYVGTENSSTGAEVWEYGSSWRQVNSDGFGDSNNYSAAGMASYNGNLYVATYNESGAEVWEYGSGWSQVNSDGFGDSNTQFANGMAVYNNRLYVGTRNNETGAQVWTKDIIFSGTYCVDNVNGTNDASHGTSSDTGAWKTLHYALDQINDGFSGTYILNVALGTYSTGNGEANDSLSISQDNVTIIGESGSMPVLDGTDASTWMIGIEIAATNVTIKNLTLKSFADWGLRISSVTGALIDSCEIHDNGLLEDGGGIHIENCSPDIRKNKIHANYPAGIFIAGNRAEASPSIKRNEIYDNNIGISVNGYETGGSATPSIINNLIYDTSSTMEYGIQVSGTMSGIASPTIYHNTIDKGLSYGIYILNVGGTTTPDIQHNIITNFGAYGINNTAGSPTIDYNDVWNNSQGDYSGCEGFVGAHDISDDPLYASYELQTGSPCIDAIPTDSSDPVTIDYSGYARPKDAGFDMGAYEFIADIAHNFALPGGTGDATDYQMFTIPVTLASGSSLKESMESVLGTYDKGIWRVFAWDPSSSAYIEMDDPSFADLEVYPGRGFWVISTSTDTITFSGQPAPDGDYTEVPLSPGWNMVALPWPATSIELDNIAVNDGPNSYWITSTNNTLTQQYVWDYTGTGASNGYEQRASSATLQPGTAYWIKVLASTDVTMLVPKDNEEGHFTAVSVRAVSEASTTRQDTEQPPPPPGLSVSFDSTSSDGGTRVSGSGGCFIETAGHDSKTELPHLSIIIFSAILFFISLCFKGVFQAVLSLVLGIFAMTYGGNKRRCH